MSDTAPVQNRTMRVLVGDDLVEDDAPEHWTEQVLREVAGQKARFGLAAVEELVFDAGADHNRGHVLVRVKAFSLDERCFSEVLGTGPGAVDGTRGLGSDFVGEVAAVGSAVQSLAVGDRVIPSHCWPPRDGWVVEGGRVTSSASREWLRLRAEDLAVVPTDLPDDVAAAMPTLGPDLFGILRRADPQATDRVLLCGDSPDLPGELVDLVVTTGAQVTVLSRSPARIEASCHPDRADPVAFFAVDDQAGGLRRRALEGEGFDVVIDLHPELYAARATALMGFGSRYVTTFAALSAEPQGASILPMEAGRNLAARNASILLQRQGTRVDLDAAIAAWVAGNWSPRIDSSYGPGSLQAFLERSFDRPDRSGPVLFRYSEDA